MNIYQTDINDCIYIATDVYKDNRGSFMETYSIGKYINHIGGNNWIQSNVSVSNKNVLRGLHFQTGYLSQAKLITVLHGSVRDVVVDCRRDSSTYGNVCYFDLNSATKHQVYVPKGCAHGFLSLEHGTLFHYLCDNPYHKNSESGILFSDKELNIQWGVPKKELIVSDKDKALPSWKDGYKF